MTLCPDETIYVAGHTGLVGSALVRCLKRQGFSNLLLRTRAQVDLTRQAEVEALFQAEKPAVVFLAAAHVGGILANRDYPADFLYNNLMIEANVLHAACQVGVRQLLFLGSSCIYPRDCPQPISEDALLTGPLEVTNHAYAVSKIAGIALCQAYNRQHHTRFLAGMPCNLYGPGDCWDLQTSHVIPALMQKFIRATLENHPTVTVWGTGTPRREFLHVDDCAEACVFLMQQELIDGPINIGCGQDIRIADLAALIQEITGYPGERVFDTTRPDGTPQKCLDVSRIRAMGWHPRIPIEAGLRDLYRHMKTTMVDGSGEIR